MAVNHYNQVFRRTHLSGFNVGSRTTFALSTNFTLGSAGTCLGTRFTSPVTANLVDAYFFLSAVDAVGRNLRVHICGMHASAATRPGTSATYVDVAGGTTIDKWLKATFSSSHAVVAGETYWVVIGDPAGADSGYGVINRSASGPYYNEYAVFNYASTDGFATAGTSASVPNAVVIKFSDGTVIGCPWTNIGNFSGGALERGVKIGPLDADVYVCGIFFSAGLTDTDLLYVRCYEGDTAPDGTIYSGFNGGTQYTIPANSRYGNSQLFFGNTRLRAGYSYRFTFAGSGGSFTYPYYSIVQDPAAGIDDFKACGASFVPNYATISDGAGGWTTYDNASDGLWFGCVPIFVSTIPITNNHAKAAQLVGSGGL